MTAGVEAGVWEGVTIFTGIGVASKPNNRVKYISSGTRTPGEVA